MVLALIQLHGMHQTISTVQEYTKAGWINPYTTSQLRAKAEWESGKDARRRAVSDHVIYLPAPRPGTDRVRVKVLYCWCVTCYQRENETESNLQVCMLNSLLPGQKWRKESLEDLEDLDELEECNFCRVVWQTCADNMVTTQNYSAAISHNFTAVPASKRNFNNTAAKTRQNWSLVVNS